MQSTDGSPWNAATNVVNLSPDHMVDHPAGAHYVLWNGPAFLDVGVPTGEFVRFAVANLPAQWTLLIDAQGRPLPLAVRASAQGLAICWLPYDGPGVRQAGHSAGGLSDADYAAALQKLSATHYQGLMNTAWGVGGWSTHRA